MADLLQTLELTATATATKLTPSDHPNIMRFQGVLLRLNEPSTKAPNGSDGHRILVTSSTAKKNLHTLIGMGLNYAPSLKEHAQRRKVGVITGAQIKGNELWVTADIWKHDFPEAERDLKRPGLGMSMEINQVDVKDKGAPIWELSDFCFLGATILEKNAAAYNKTLAIAAKAEERKNMADKVIKKVDGVKVYQMAASAAVKEVMNELRPIIQGLQASNAELAKANTELTETVAGIAVQLDGMSFGVTAGKEDKEDDEEGCDMKSEMAPTMMTKKVSAKAKDEESDDDDDEEDDDEEIDSAGEADTGDLEYMGEKPGSEEDDPGHMNKDAKNMGSKTDVQNKLGPTVSKGGIIGSARLKAALQANKQLAASNRELQAQISKLTKKVTRIGATVKAAAEVQGRRSVALPNDLVGILAKGGINASEMTESGSKITASDLDALIAGSGLNFTIVERMRIKNVAQQNGILEDSQVRR